MATLKQRLHRKNSSGSYDTIHLETSSSLVMRPSGRTVEQDLEAYLPKVQDSDTVPESLSRGQLVAGPSKAWLGGMGEIGHPYSHPSTKQCNYSVDTSGFATTTQLNELKTSVSNGKSAIASAITDKGISTAASAGFSTMANNIRKIKVNEPHCFVTQSDFTFTTVNGTTMKITSSLFSKLLQITNGEYKLRASIYGSYGIQSSSTSGVSSSRGMFTIAKGSNQVNIDSGIGRYRGIYTLYDTYIMVQITASDIYSIRFTPGTNSYGSPDGWIYI